jgi:hypothetical protein
MKNFLAVCVIVLSVYKSYAQTPLPVPKEFSKAIEKGTRTMTGQPGSSYWQNHSEYKIKAHFDPKSRVLKGTETIIYYNESPDDLSQLVLRLYPDIFKKNFKDDGTQNIDDTDKTDGTEISMSKVNGKEIKPERRGTNMFLKLVTPLKSKGKATVEIAWEYTIPAKTHIREGTYFQTSFMIAYWYPQMAVYDDIDGWDVLDYTGQQEFYNDFSDFDVEISTPNSHQIWATGVLQNPKEIYTSKYFERYEKALTSDEVVKIITKEERANKKEKFTLGKSQNTFKFKAEHVPDFAFAASDTYLWDMTSVVVDDQTQRRTAVGAIYHPSSRDFYKVCSYARQCVDYFSHKLPGIAYPYPRLTVFNGDGGMEFPMFVNDGSYNDNFAAEVTAHEIAHTYFPFYMGINERKFAWMDEGWAQTLPNDIEFNINNNIFKPQQDNATEFAGYVARIADKPLMTPSYEMAGNPYIYASYMRPSQAYTTLKVMLGDELFGKALREYMARWNGKHPQPFDFFNSFNDYLKEDLTWFWKPWFFESNKPDLGIKEVNKIGNSLIVKIQKVGALPIPIQLTVNFEDDTKQKFTETPRVWQNASEYTFNITIKTDQKVRSLVLGDYLIPDISTRNNTFMMK